jgi:peptidoglycan/xylan/chitin deacetylase (PgdA/CDA1 family)
VRRAPLALRSRSSRRDRLAWAAALVLLPLAVVATRAWLHRPVPMDGVAGPVHTRDFRLPVLAYDRVARGAGEGHLDAERVAEHLAALRRAGFRPVTLRQVHDAYRRGAPLPERPVLLTFDGGHLSTEQAVDPLLRRARWPAVMLVNPSLPERRHSTYVYWDRLRRMVRSGVWDLGVTGPWAEGTETVARRLGGYEVLATAASEGGPGDESPPDLPPPLAFEDTLFGINDASSDPLRLARLRVPRAWSGEALVERLAFSVATPAPRSSSGEPAPVSPRRWVAAAGRLDVDGDVVTLSGTPRAEAWLAGGEWAHDFVLEAEVRPEGGPFWFVQQRVGSREQWRWGGTATALYLQRLRPGEPVEVVSRVERSTAPGSWHTVRIVKRGEGVWVEWDGVRVGEMPRSVGTRWRGHVGIATGGPTDVGGVTVRNVRFAEIPWELRVVSGSPPREEVQALLEEGARVAAISPPWLVQKGGKLARRPADRRLLTMIAAHGAWELVPTVELTDDQFAAARRAAELAELAAGEGWAGIRLVPGAPGTGAVPEEAVEEWERVFSARGLRFVHAARAAPLAEVPR